MRCIELDYKEDQVHIKFKDQNPKITQIRLDAVVCTCDETLLSCDGYRHLAAVVPILFHEYLVADRRNKINELINAQIHVGTFNIDQDIDQDDYFNEPSDILVNSEEVGNGAFRSFSFHFTQSINSYLEIRRKSCNISRKYSLCKAWWGW